MLKRVAKKKPARPAAAMNKEVRDLRKYLIWLTQNVGAFLEQIDAAMKQPDSPERGRNIARLCNALEFANDGARYHSLGVDFRKDSPARKAKESARSDLADWPRWLAERIAAEIFEVGRTGRMAYRLALKSEDGRELGAWGQGPMRDAIGRMLSEAGKRKAGRTPHDTL